MKEKKEGKIRKLKVDLIEATAIKAVEVGDSEDAPYRSKTDFDGNDNWTVKQKTEASGILCPLFCKKGNQLNVHDLKDKILNEWIQKKYATYSTDSKTSKMIETAIKNKRSTKEYEASKVGKCYRYVKDAMVASGIVEDRPVGVSPRYAGEQLSSRGFVNIMEDKDLQGKIIDPAQAPKGAILVYEPVPITRLVLVQDEKSNRKVWVPDYGHIEIKTADAGQPGFVSDYQSQSARTGKSLETDDRKLIGIFVKKPDQVVAKK